MADAPTPAMALKAAVTQFGSQSAFARLLDVSQTAVWKWLSQGKVLPAEHVLAVEEATGVSKHDLRPDIYPPTDGVAAAPHPVASNRLAVLDDGAA